MQELPLPASVNEDQLSAQTPWYLVMAANLEVLLLYPSLILFTCPLMPLSLQTNPRDHILVFISTETPSRAISRLWVTLCSGLGNVTFTDLKGPFNGRQQCLSGIPQRICMYALELKGRAHILLHPHNYSMTRCNREQSKRSFQGWKSPVEIRCLISVDRLRSEVLLSAPSTCFS